MDAIGGVSVLVRGPDRQDRDALVAADLGVTVAAHALADTGTLVVFASAGEHRLDSLLPPVHVALLAATTIVAGLGEAVEALRRASRFDAHSAITFIRGPSRTADIELTLTVGVHGPRRVHCVVWDDGARG
jgi:L-lactate dehydrogenase complex protein LldG